MKLLTRPKGRSLPLMLAAIVLMSTSPMVTGCSRGDDQPAAASSSQAQPSVAAVPESAAPAPAAAVEPGPQPGSATAQELQELVSPIALYPDVLVAQILAGSTYPTQVVEADRWVKQNPKLSGDQLAAQVNPQPWDPSIKSLTQFPTVLQTMSDNLAWTSSLGEAYYNQPGDVMIAIQTLRNMAINAGTLKTTPQQKVEVEPAPPDAKGGGQSVQQTVIIQPAQPNTVYVPQYNPTTAYGAPVPAPAGYTGSDLLLTGVLSFGAGMLLGSLINNGNNNWGCNWNSGGSYHSSSVKYNNKIYVTNNNVYPGRPPSAGYPGYRPPAAGYPRPGYPARPMPYPATKPAYNSAGGYNRSNNGAIPTTRPYNPATAKPYAANNPNLAKPNFPKASSLPNNPAASNLNGKAVPKPQPNQPVKPVASTRPTAASKQGNRAADPARGFTKDSNSTGSRNNALSGYEPGGNAKASSDRGQASLRNSQTANSGRGNGSGGGGNARRGGGGGGGGVNRGGRQKGK